MADTRRVHRINKAKSDINDYSDPYASSYSSKSKSTFKNQPSSVITASSKHSRSNLLEEGLTTKKRQVLLGRLSRSNSRSPPPALVTSHRQRSRNKSQSQSPSRGRTVMKASLSPLPPYHYNNNRNRTTLIIRTPRSPTPRSRTPPAQRNRSREKSWSKSRSKTRSRSKGKDDTSKLAKLKSKNKKSKQPDEKLVVKEKEKEKSSSSKDKSNNISKDKDRERDKEKEREKEKDKSLKDKDSKKKQTSTSTSLNNKQSNSSSTIKDSKSTKSSSKSANHTSKSGRSPSPVKNKSSSTYVKSSVSSTSASLSKTNKSDKKFDLSNELKKKKKSLSKSPRSRAGSSDKNYEDNYHNRSRGSSAAKSRSRTRSRTRSRSSSEHGYSYGRNKASKSSYPTNGRRSPPIYPKKNYSAPVRRPGYPDDAELSGEESAYEPGHPPIYRYGGRPYQGRGGYNDPNIMPHGPYGMPNSNRNQFYPMPPGGHMPPYMHNAKYMGKFNKKYYQNMGPQMEAFPGPEGANNYDGPSMPPPYQHHYIPNHPRFNPNYRYLGNQFNPHFNSGNGPHYPPHPMMKQMPGGPFPPKTSKANESEQIVGENSELNASEIGSSTSPNSVPVVVIDPELVNAVQEITTAMANATSAGKELTLTPEQSAILQKHQQLVQQQQTQQQNQLNALQNPLLAKNKFQNYRMLGRNIFEPNKTQYVPKKRINKNTYYSRFIKQHPTNNLPLAFQKSVSLAEDKALEEKEKENQQVGNKKSKKKRSKRSKKKKNSDDSSNSMSDSESSTSSRSSSRSSGSSRSNSSSSSKSNSSTSSTSSPSSPSSENIASSSDGEIKKPSSNAENSFEGKKKLKKKDKKKLKRKAKKLASPNGNGEHLVDQALSELPLNGEETVKKLRDHSASSSSSKSSILSSSSGEIKPAVLQAEKKVKKTKKPKTKKTKTTKRKSKRNPSLFDNDNNTNGDSDGSMLDLKENLRPIGAYIKDRERMLIEMFRCIKGAKLQAMLPDLLKNKPLKEIKARCLDQLDIMSKKRIRCLLDDKAMTSSSGTDDSSDESDSSFNQSTNIKGNTSQDNNTAVINSDEKKKAKVKGNAASKFKPIGFGEVNKSNEVKQPKESARFSLKTEENEDEDDENNSQENDSNENQSEANAGNVVGNSNQQQQSGIAAAGFKKFVKKSISIKIKTNESSSNLAGENIEKDEKSEKDRANNLLVQKHHISKINKAKLGLLNNPTQNNIVKKIEDEVSNEISGMNDLDNNNIMQKLQQQQLQMPQQNLSESEKLRAQYNQYNKTQQQLNPKSLNQQYPRPGLMPHAGAHSYMNVPPGNPVVQGYVPPPASFSVPPPSLNPRFHLQQPPPGMLPVNGPPPTHLHQMPASQSLHHHPHHHQQHQQQQQQQQPQLNNNSNYMHQMLQNNSVSYNPYQYQQQQQHTGMLHQQMPHHNNMHPQQALQNLNTKGNKHPFIHDDDFEDEINVNVNDDAAYDLDDYYNENNVLSDDQDDHKNKSNNTVDYDYDLGLDNIKDLFGSSKKTSRSGRHRHHRRRRSSPDKADSDEELDEDDDSESLFEVKTKSKRRKQSSKQSKSKSKRNKRKHLNSDDEEEEEEEQDDNVEQEEPDIESLKEMLINILRAQIDDENEVDEEIKLTLNVLLSQVEEDKGTLSYEDLSNMHFKIKELLTCETSDQNEDEAKMKRKKKRSKQRSYSKDDIDSDIQDNEEISDKLNKKAFVGQNRAPNKKKRRFQEESHKKESNRSSKDRSNKEYSYTNAEVEAGEIDDVYDDQYKVEEEFQDLLMNKRR